MRNSAQQTKNQLGQNKKSGRTITAPPDHQNCDFRFLVHIAMWIIDRFCIYIGRISYGFSWFCAILPDQL